MDILPALCLSQKDCTIAKTDLILIGLKNVIFEIVSSFASPSLNRVTGQNYRKFDFPLEVWNRLSSDKTEGVTIVSDRISSGTIRCGVSCQNNPECGGFLYDKTSGSCTMKSVKNVLE